ncbi:MAG: response regulator [bacterium]|nr:response regulator [bacterium]
MSQMLSPIWDLNNSTTVLSLEIPVKASEGTILVVDDSSATVEIIGALLKNEGYQVLCAENGHEALEKIRKNRPDLVILDILMPGMDGLEVIQRCKKESAGSEHPPFLVISGICESEFRVKALTLGAVEFLIKPFNRIEFLSRVRTQLEIVHLNRKLRERAEALSEMNRVLRETQERLIQAEKLTAVSEISGAINHELNQPLTVILGQTQLLLDELPRGYASRERAEKIFRNTQRIGQALKNLGNIRSYRTKNYDNNSNIFDLG